MTIAVAEALIAAGPVADEKTVKDLVVTATLHGLEHPARETYMEKTGNAGKSTRSHWKY